MYSLISLISGSLECFGVANKVGMFVSLIIIFEKQGKDTESDLEEKNRGHLRKRTVYYRRRRRRPRKIVNTSNSEAEPEEVIPNKKRPNQSLISTDAKAHAIDEVVNDKAAKSLSYGIKKQVSVGSRVSHFFLCKQMLFLIVPLFLSTSPSLARYVYYDYAN